MARHSDSNSVQKVCRILRVLSSPQPLRLTDICAQTGLNKATALRLLGELQRESYVSRDPDSKRFTLGEDALALGIALQSRDHLRDRARPWLVKLAAETGDSVFLCTQSGIDMLCVDRELGTFPIRANMLDIGTRWPLGVSAGGLALLAWLPDEAARVVLDLSETTAQRFPRINRRYLEEAIAETRQHGHALVTDIVFDRLSGIAVPIFAANGRPIASLVIAALNERITSRVDALALQMKEAANALGEREPIAA